MSKKKQDQKKPEKWSSELIPSDFDAAYKSLTDRELAIVAAGVIDAALVELLSARLSGGADEIAKFLGEDGNPEAPVGTLSLRIKVAYFVGLIHEPERDVLNALRSIRNRMAHRVNVKFDDPIIIEQAGKAYEALKQSLKEGRGFDEVFSGEYEGTSEDVRSVVTLSLVLAQANFSVVHENMIRIPSLVDHAQMNNRLNNMTTVVAAEMFVNHFFSLFPNVAGKISREDVRAQMDVIGNASLGNPESASPDWWVAQIMSAFGALSQAYTVPETEARLRRLLSIAWLIYAGMNADHS